MISNNGSEVVETRKNSSTNRIIPKSLSLAMTTCLSVSTR